MCRLAGNPFSSKVGEPLVESGCGDHFVERGCGVRFCAETRWKRVSSVQRGGGVSSSSGVCEDAANDIGEMVGTIALFSAILLGILLVHVVIISGIEAYWLAKVRQ